MTTESQVRQAVAAQRQDLAAVLAGLDATQWDAPSLCAGWRVREVVAHITMAFRYSLGRTLFELGRSAGRFNAMADRTARRDAEQLSSTELIAALRDNVDHDWKPPGAGYEGALAHDVIHGLDITVGLGLDHPVPLDRMRIVLGSLTTRQVKFFDADLAGVELRADDLDWHFGAGDLVRGRAQDLLLVVCDRKLPPGHVRGHLSHRFVQSTGGA